MPYCPSRPGAPPYTPPPARHLSRIQAAATESERVAGWQDGLLIRVPLVENRMDPRSPFSLPAGLPYRAVVGFLECQ